MTKKKLNSNHISRFREQVKQVPTFSRVVYNRCFYKKTVKFFNSEKCTCARNVFTSVGSFDGYEYIYLTCDKKAYIKLLSLSLLYFKLVGYK